MISKQEAIQIAIDACVNASEKALRNSEYYRCLDPIPGSYSIYNMPTEPSWCIYAPWEDGLEGKMLRSSRVILISKESGKVLYDGSANDEG